MGLLRSHTLLTLSSGLYAPQKEWKSYGALTQRFGFESENKRVLGLFTKPLTQLWNRVIEHFSVSDGRRPVGVSINARFLNTFTKRTAGVKPAG